MISSSWQMLRSSFILAGVALVALACTGDDPTFVGSNPDADAGVAPSGNLTLTTQGPLTIVQGEIAKAPVTVGRGPAVTGPVSIVVSNPPADVSAAPLVVAPDQTTGELQLKAGPAAAHGPGTLTLVATADSESAIATLEVFVRGTPGSLDTSFGTAGTTVVDLGSGNVRPVAIARQGSEKVVVLAQAEGTCVVARLDHDGKVDATFGDGGKRILDGDGDMQCGALAVQPDGKIVVAGSRVPGVFGFYEPFVARFDATGAPDPTFASGGTFSPGKGDEGSLLGLVLQPDGKILAAGSAPGEDGRSAMYVLRLTTGGAPDGGFGDGGTTLIESKLFPSNPGGVRARGAGVLGNGDVVAVGQADALIAFARLTSAGKLVADSAMTFNLGNNSGVTNDVRHVITTGPDRMVVALSATDTVERAGLLGLSGGKPDPAFGSFGRVLVDLDPTGGAFFGATALQDGRILAVGSTPAPPNTEWALARVSDKGELDLAFGAQGKVTTSIGPHADAAHAAVAVSENRAIVVGSSTSASGAHRPILARYWL